MPERIGNGDAGEAEKCRQKPICHKMRLLALNFGSQWVWKSTVKNIQYYSYQNCSVGTMPQICIDVPSQM